MSSVVVAVRFAFEGHAAAFSQETAQYNPTPVDVDGKALFFQFQTLDEAIQFTDQHQDIHAFKLFQDDQSIMTIENKPSCLSCTMPLDKDTTTGSSIPTKLCALCDYNSIRSCFAGYSN